MEATQVRNQLVKSAAIVAGALLIAACGTNQPRTENTPGAGAAACDTSKGTLVIGMIAPLSGSLSALGQGMKNSASLAVDQANEKCTVPGYKLAFQPEDDQATAQIGAQAATKLSSDPNVVAVIGTLNSSVAQNAAPVLRTKNILMISPANTNPTLTRGQDYLNNPKREWPNYFRVCATDAVQGPFAATYAADKAGKKRVAIVTDGKTYGDGLAAEFRKQLESKGGTIVAQEKVGEKDTDFSGVIAKIKPSTPELVYYGGEYPAAGPLSKQMKDAGMDVPLFGGDGIYDPKFIELGGKEGDLATSVGAPTESLQSAKAFVDAYNAKKYAEGFSAYGAFSYDAANVIISSLAKTIAGSAWGEDKRQPLLTNVGSYSGTGATGEIKFDEFGDTTNKILTVYQVTGGKWNPVETGAFQA
jgi:branched-chain amino acid transport system substrate-binding protein